MAVVEVEGVIPTLATWRVIPVSNSLAAMVSKPPNWGCSPSKWLINRDY